VVKREANDQAGLPERHDDARDKPDSQLFYVESGADVFTHAMQICMHRRFLYFSAQSLPHS